MRNGQDGLHFAAIVRRHRQVAFEDSPHERRGLERRGEVLVAAGALFLPDHLPLQAGVGQAQPGHDGGDGLHPDPVDQHVGRHVVGDGDHHDRQVVQRKRRGAVAEVPDVPAPAHPLLGPDCDRLVDVHLAARLSHVHRHQDRHLDGAPLREDEALVHAVHAVGGEVDDGDPHDAGQLPRDLVERLLVLGRQDLPMRLLGGHGLGGCGDEGGGDEQGGDRGAEHGGAPGALAWV